MIDTKGDRDRDRQNEIFHLSVHCPPVRCRPKPGALNSSGFPTWVAVAQAREPSFCLLLLRVSISRQLESEAKLRLIINLPIQGSCVQNNEVKGWERVYGNLCKWIIEQIAMKQVAQFARVLVKS